MDWDKRSAAWQYLKGSNSTCWYFYLRYEYSFINDKWTVIVTRFKQHMEIYLQITCHIRGLASHSTLKSKIYENTICITLIMSEFCFLSLLPWLNTDNGRHSGGKFTWPTFSTACKPVFKSHFSNVAVDQRGAELLWGVWIAQVPQWLLPHLLFM